VDRCPAPTAMFRAYSAERRDRAPIIETEDFRDEGARRFWDDFSPPYYGFKKGPNDTWRTTTPRASPWRGIKRYWAYYSNRISNTDPAHSKLVRLLLHLLHRRGRRRPPGFQRSRRVSGKVDAVRLPKEIYFAHRVMQNEQPDIHILGHWTYPPPSPTAPRR
jgi:beta-galactosidase